MMHPDLAHMLYRQQERELVAELRARAERECCEPPRTSTVARWAGAAVVAVNRAVTRGREVMRSTVGPDPMCCPAGA